MKSSVDDRPRSAALEGAKHVQTAFVAVLMSPLRFVRWLAAWLTYWMGDSRRRVMFGVVSLVCLLALLGTRVERLELRYEEALVSRAQAAESFFIPPPLALEAASLGHPAFVADMLFMRAAMYFINHLFTDRVFDWLDTYMETIIALDPDNPRFYEWASQSVKFGQLITNDVLERSNDYARQGIERYPDHWRFYYDIGFNYYMEWKFEAEGEREAMRKKALPWFSIASALPGTSLDPNFVAELYLQENDVEMALFHAYQRYWEASERERAALRARINRFESEAAARRLADTEASWKARYPYVPIGLFELLGAAPEVSVPRGGWADASPLGAIEEERTR